MEDEIILYENYGKIESMHHYDLTGVNEKQVVLVLANTSEYIERKGYEFAGINVGEFDKFISEKSKTHKTIDEFIELEKKKVNKFVKTIIPTSRHMQIAESYVINRLFETYAIPRKIHPKEVNAKLPKEVKCEMNEKRIAFIGHYKKWMVVKKLTTEKAENWELSGILSSINFTCVNASFKFLKVEEPTIKKRKHKWDTILEVLEESNKIKDKFAKALFISRNLENARYSPYLQPRILIKAYPDIKPPKPRGRLPK